MDPVAALIELIESLANGSTSDARDHLSDLVDWVDAGGFMPAVEVQRHHNKTVVSLWHR